jgi:ABC-type phosphate transport system substrate-binding protein
MVKKIAFAVAMVLAGSLSAWAAETTGAGSTFVYPILSKWAADYALRSGNKVNYQPIVALGESSAINVRYGALCGLKSDICRGPGSADCVAKV